MSTYRISRDARSDLAAIRRYLTNEAGKPVAEFNLKKITAAFKLLGENPGAGHTREDLTGLPVRFWSVYSYMIVYNPSAGPIRILRVLHGSQDLETLLDSDIA
jgi:plasmid stabilization system protein ParE